MLCLSIHPIFGIVGLDRSGAKTEMNRDKQEAEVLCNPHMPAMIRPEENRTHMTKQFAHKTTQEVFTEIYKTNFWLGTQSLSGQGSSILTTKTVRSELPKLFKVLNVQSMVDAGCGDFYWMQTVDLSNISYIGTDIVPDMIHTNRTHFGNERRHFLCLDVTADPLPRADLILCRDVIAHLDYQKACKALRNFKESGSTFLLMTTHASGVDNRQIVPGDHCPYDMTKPPFNLPEPLAIIEELEAEPETAVQKKAMGLWLLRDLDLTCLQEEEAIHMQPQHDQHDDAMAPLRTADGKTPRILHMSFHLGCIKEVESVARKLGLDVTSWYVFDKPLVEFEGCNSGFEVYNMLPDRAQRIWEKHKQYFDTFDIIWISDTAPLSRVFLQNDWKKPLVIWICNRFDYCHWPSEFPDPAYHELFRQATKKKNVYIIPYAPYEWYYAYTKGVYLNTFTIKPIGVIETTDRYKNADKSVPTSVDKKNTIFIYPRLNAHELAFVKNKCNELNIPSYSGPYNGSHDIKDFKGILFFMYGAWLNIAMFENFQRGLVHFLPSVNFAEELKRTGSPVSAHPYVSDTRLYELCEWYSKEHKDLIVYYDSWQDLKHKIETTDYEAMRKKIMAFAQQHEQEMLSRWRMVFQDVYKGMSNEYR